VTLNSQPARGAFGSVPPDAGSKLLDDVEDEFGKPARCSDAITRTGWLYLAYPRKWYPVDSCERHVDQLEERPRPIVAERVDRGT